MVGTTAPGATVDVDAVNIDIAGQATTATGTADSAGNFSIPVTVPPGTVTLTVTATAPNGATGYAQRTVVYDVVPGTLVYSTTDPTGDDNGPGTYGYPTPVDVFHPGAFDLQKFEVYDSGADTVTFRVQTANLSPTFGSPLGAQLLDLYIQNPAGGTTSTAASYPGRNYQIASGSAWNRLIEVQGFGQRFIDGSGSTLGSVSIRAAEATRNITFTVAKAALGGTPASGWTFSVVLTGQDGFSSDQARGFQPTPQDYQFGVCRVGVSSPDLRSASGHRAEGRRRPHPRRRQPGRRARPDAPRPGDHHGGDDPLAHAPPSPPGSGLLPRQALPPGQAFSPLGADHAIRSDHDFMIGPDLHDRTELHDQRERDRGGARGRCQARRTPASWWATATWRPVASHTSQVSSIAPPPMLRATVRTRSGPAAGTPRTKTLYCRVGVHPTCRPGTSKLGGGSASAMQISASGSAWRPSSNRTQARSSPAPLGRPMAKPADPGSSRSATTPRIGTWNGPASTGARGQASSGGMGGAAGPGTSGSPSAILPAVTSVFEVGRHAVGRRDPGAQHAGAAPDPQWFDRDERRAGRGGGGERGRRRERVRVAVAGLREGGPGRDREQVAAVQLAADGPLLVELGPVAAGAVRGDRGGGVEGRQGRGGGRG